MACCHLVTILVAMWLGAFGGAQPKLCRTGSAVQGSRSRRPTRSPRADYEERHTLAYVLLALIVLHCRSRLVDAIRKA